MKIFKTKQIAEIDQYTIKNEPISDIELMERASLKVTDWMVKKFSNETPLIFFAGFGNNGGDALAIARLLANYNFQCKVYALDIGKKTSSNFDTNWDRLVNQRKVELYKLTDISQFPSVHEHSLIIDGLFGSGLTRAIEGLSADIIRKINDLPNKVIAIDIPSGLMGENNSSTNRETIIQADYTLTFQFPKISFLLPENEKFVGKWKILPIGLHPDGIERTFSNFYYTLKRDVKFDIKKRTTFNHKGDNGHALLISGSFGKMGATVLSSKACMRSGIGLLTTHIPQCGYEILQSVAPEVMVKVDRNENFISEIENIESYEAIGIGPGIGVENETAQAFKKLIDIIKIPLVIDADGLNILSRNKSWIELLPENTVLTPHIGEFKRLVGDFKNDFDKIEKQIDFAVKNKLVIVLKGAYTSVALPNGDVHFNSTGNSGMATAGSGDVLTGIILSLLAQGYSPQRSAIIGVYLHGLAGDNALTNQSKQSLIATDIIENIGNVYKSLA